MGFTGEPRGISVREDGAREGVNTDRYDENEIRRIGRLAFEAARKRGGRLCSVDKANVLEVTMLWREVMESLRPEFPDVSLSHMYVDNAAMQLVREPSSLTSSSRGISSGIYCQIPPRCSLAPLDVALSFAT